MKYLQIQIKNDGIIFSGWHNYPTRYNIEYLTDEQLHALIHRIEYDLFPFIQGRHEGCSFGFASLISKASRRIFDTKKHKK